MYLLVCPVLGRFRLSSWLQAQHGNFWAIPDVTHLSMIQSADYELLYPPRNIAPPADYVAFVRLRSIDGKTAATVDHQPHHRCSGTSAALHRRADLSLARVQSTTGASRATRNQSPGHPPGAGQDLFV